MQVSTLGVDLAKNVFQLHGADEHGRCRLRKTVKRASLLRVMANLPLCRVGIEACGGAHHWAREFRRLGHEVRIMGLQYVKPYVKTQKNDYNDAEAICEAVSRPNMHFVPVKEIEHQDILALHRIRRRLVGSRTALVNQIRGLLAEYGLVMPQRISQVRQRARTSRRKRSPLRPPITRRVDRGSTFEVAPADSAPRKYLRYPLCSSYPHIAEDRRIDAGDELRRQIDRSIENVRSPEGSHCKGTQQDK